MLVHGFTDNGRCWAPVAKALSDRYDVIMPDMRGHGRSERFEPGERVDMARDLAALIVALGLKNLVLCGHSMGAMVAFQTAVRFPGLVSSLVLEDPAWFMPSSAPPIFSADLQDNPMAQWVESLKGQSLEDLLEGYRKDHPDWDADLIRAMAESKKQLDPHAWSVIFPRMGGDKWPWWETLAGLKQPLLLITGNPERGAIVTPEMADKVLTLKGDTQIVRFEKAGHLIRFDEPEPFLEALKRFLSSRSPR